MARPSQFERPDDLTREATAVKIAIKHLSPQDRALLIAWMLLYYQNDGAMFSPQINRRRQRSRALCYAYISAPRRHLYQCLRLKRYSSLGAP
jgi:hypothetical protein